MTTGKRRLIHQLLSKLKKLNTIEDIDKFVEAVAPTLPDAANKGLITIDEFQIFIFAKNVKIYGGINEYIDDFLDSMLPSLRKMNREERNHTIIGMVIILERMYSYPGIDNTHKRRVQHVLLKLKGVRGTTRRKRRVLRRQTQSRKRFW